MYLRDGQCSSKMFIFILILVCVSNASACPSLDEQHVIEGSFRIGDTIRLLKLTIPQVVDKCTNDIFISNIYDVISARPNQSPGYLTREAVIVNNSYLVDCRYEKETFTTVRDKRIERFFNIILISSSSLDTLRSSSTSTSTTTTAAPSTTALTCHAAAHNGFRLSAPHSSNAFDWEFAFPKFYNDVNDLVQWTLVIIPTFLLFFRRFRRWAVKWSRLCGSFCSPRDNVTFDSTSIELSSIVAPVRNAQTLKFN